MKILSIVGARPQFIKLAPISAEIRKKHNEIILHTGQHYDYVMSDGIFEELQLPKPDYNLEIGSGMHGRQTGRMLEKIEKILIDERPDVVILFGDTNSTLAGAIAAAKLSVLSIHIEAGLRSYNREMPEEINRVVSDYTCDYLFVPTKSGVENLEKEGLAKKAWISGDIMVDTLQNSLDAALSRNTLKKTGVKKNGFYLLTLHRPYNVDKPERLQLILNRLGQLQSTILFPAHPRTKKKMEINKLTIPGNIQIASPFGYLDFLNLQYNSLKIITDSGGIQKEAYILEKPCLTLRTETEWTETIDEGWNHLIQPENDNFIQEVEAFGPPKTKNNIFGKNVAKKMVSKIEELIAVA